MAPKSRIVGIDYGRVRVGVAISDESQMIARTLTCLSGGKQFPKLLAKELTAYPYIDAIVVGLPLQMNGKEGIMAQEVRAFVAILEKELPYRVTLWDERLTSAQAERTLKEAEFNRKKRSQMVDNLAAVLILQNYLDSNRPLA